MRDIEYVICNTYVVALSNLVQSLEVCQVVSFFFLAYLGSSFRIPEDDPLEGDTPAVVVVQAGWTVVDSSRDPLGVVTVSSSRDRWVPDPLL